MSVSACRLVRSMASSAVRVWAGRWSSAVSPAPAWMTITLTWCVTMSCSSRAIRSRSSWMARRSRFAWSASRIRALSSIAAWYRRRVRTQSPSAQTTVTATSVETSPERAADAPAFERDRAVNEAATTSAAVHRDASLGAFGDREQRHE